MATMTVLPSFQAFLQSATGSHSPSAAVTASNPAAAASPTLLYPPQAPHLSPTAWAAAADRLYLSATAEAAAVPSPCSSSSEEDEELLGHGFKRRLAAAGAGSVGGATSEPSAAKRQKKKYLKERERCEIVRRVRAGEKQAHLAKEFGVSRAAVCYLLKHQKEILLRSSERL